jgi:hypothetical protein
MAVFSAFVEVLFCTKNLLLLRSKAYTCHGIRLLFKDYSLYHCFCRLELRSIVLIETVQSVVLCQGSLQSCYKRQWKSL